VWSIKSSLVKFVFSPQDKFVAGSDGSLDFAAEEIQHVTSSNGKTGSGECLPKSPEGGSVPVAITSRRNDLQAHDSGSLPVENRFGKHVDTNKLDAAQEIKGEQGQIKRNKVENITSTINCKRVIQRDTQVLGYVPIQVVNLSLDEVE